MAPKNRDMCDYNIRFIIQYLQLPHFVITRILTS